jgi:aminoglycoside phosphotransferase (APT) family kinase protein
MARARMHDDEVITDAELVRGLLAAQQPSLADLPISYVESFGTDHDVYRLGDEHSVRLPRIADAQVQGEREARWLPRFAPNLPLRVPVPVASGRPANGYPYTWVVHEWLPGRAACEGLRNLDRAADDLAGFVCALHALDITGAHERSRGGRGSPLIEIDARTQRWLDELAGRADVPALRRLWEESLAAPAHDGVGVWVHGDLLPGNLLVVDDRLSAVIDFGTLNVGDPAADLLPAWSLFDRRSRDRYLTALGVDNSTYLRGRGWALSQAVGALAYYWDTNPGMVAQGWRTLGEVLSDG